MSLLDPQLQAFVAIAEHKSVHAAADVLFITQTAVTQRLKGLEQKLGVSLFSRSRRGMLITTEGEALLRYCQMTTALEGEAMAQIKGAGLKANVRMSIAGPTSVLQARVLPAVNRLMQEFPNVLIEMNYHDDDNILNLLKSGKVQLGILAKHQLAKELVNKSLKDESYILVASKKWKGRKLEDILENERIIDFNQRDNITFAYLKHFSLLEKVNQERHFANHPEAIAQLIIDARGYSVLEKSFVQSLTEEKELHLLNQGQTYKNEISLAWYERPEMPAYFAKMIELIK